MNAKHALAVSAAIVVIVLAGARWSARAEESSGDPRMQAPVRLDAWSIKSRKAKREAPKTASAEQGRALFARHCADCHGETGRGDGKNAADCDPRPNPLYRPAARALTVGAVEYMISRGLDSMPAFKDELTSSERWDLAVYVKTLQPPSGARAASSSGR